MSGQLKAHRGSTTVNPSTPTSSAYVGPIGEIIVDTDGFGHGGPLLRVQDGSTAGGWPLAAGTGGTGTVTSITAGAGLTGGTITTIGTIALGTPVTVANGGTGQSAYTDGQLLIGNTATTGLARAVITPGAGITITNGNGSITIAATAAATQTIRNINASVTLNPSDFISFVSSTAAITITLPGAPADGERHKIKDIVGNFGTFNCTINGNGHNIMTSVSAATAAMNLNGQSWELVYSANSAVWGVF